MKSLRQLLPDIGDFRFSHLIAISIFTVVAITVDKFGNAINFQTFVTTALGALVGSLSAYLFQVQQANLSERKRNHAACLKAQFILVELNNSIAAIDDALKRNSVVEINPGHDFNLEIFEVIIFSERFDFSELSFILSTSNPMVLMSLCRAERLYFHLFDALNKRNKWMEAKKKDITVFQAKGSEYKVTEADFEDRNRLTRPLLQARDFSQLAIKDALLQLKAFMQAHFNGKRILGYDGKFAGDVA
jgi:hypothetical protein